MLGFNSSEVCEGGGPGGGGGGFGGEDAAFDGEVGEAICRECQVRGDDSGKSAEGGVMGIEELLKSKHSDILRIATRLGALNVRVFGLVARGEATADSEVDFLV